MTGVLLMAYGAASSLEAIPDYLADIRQGRPSDPKLIAEITERYKAMGGRSPLLDITASQVKSLQAKLGTGFRVAMGMRHSAPRIADVYGELRKQGCETTIGLPLTPFASKLSTGAYFAKLDEAVGMHGGTTLRAPSFHDHPKLIEAIVERAKEALAKFETKPRVLFTAHSLPARIEKENDPYPRQLRETAALAAQKLALPSCDFAYQSQGRTGEDWLGPDASKTIERLAAEGAKALLVSPMGFVSDHLETLYDCDVLYREQAGKLGMRFERAAALNDHPAFIESLADAVRATLKNQGTFSTPRSYI